MRKNLPIVEFLVILALLPGGRTCFAQTNPNAQGFSIASSPSGATVHIENEVIGKTPCRFPYNLAGRYRVSAEKKGYEKWSRVFDFDKEPAPAVQIDLSRKTKTKAFLRSMVYSGWGQLYSEQQIKGKLFIALQATSLLSVGFAQYSYDQRLHDYNEALERYRVASFSFQSEQNTWKELRAVYDDLNRAKKNLRTTLVIAAGIYVLNLFDGLLHFPGDLRPIEIIAVTRWEPATSEQLSFVTLSYLF